MTDCIFDAELRTVFPEACHIDFARGLKEPVRLHIYEHPDAAEAMSHWSVKSLIDTMNQTGIDAGLLSGLPWQDKGIHDEHNAYINKCINTYPDRFKGLYMAYPDNPDRVADEIMSLDNRLYAGVEIIPKWQNSHIDDPGLDPIYQAIQHKGLYLKAYTAHLTQTLDGDSPYRLLQLLRRYPELKVLSPHLGGMLCLYGLMPGIKELLKNTYFISSVSATMLMVKFALEVNPDNILFGTDYPFNHCHDIITPLNDFKNLSIEKSIQDKVLWNNAVKLFDIKKSGVENYVSN